ncbi:MAG: hypothetical protein KC656_35715 [Myxococcales bacterium]|nr:hypothetical protein [Myxococcales bacterium]
MLALLLNLAIAADPATDRASVGVGVRAVAESWDDSALGDVYRTGMLAPAVGAVIPVIGIVQLDLEVAYRRLKPRDDGVDARLEMMPAMALVELELVHRDFGDLYLGAGPSLATFTERHPGNTTDTTTSVLRGMRGALETRAGVRIDTGLAAPSTIPDMKSGVKRIELDISGGRRFVLPSPTGFRLGAWRVQVGVIARL